jgi:hypothetical protein
VALDLVRIGDKVVSHERIDRVVQEVLRLRAEGLSQGEVAERLRLDRSFVSRLESLGEVRKGRRVALVAFPVANAQEVRELAEQMGVERVLVWTDGERQAFLAALSGRELVDELLALVADLRQFDRTVLLASERWVRLGRALLGAEVVAVTLGPTPLARDQEIDLDALAELLHAVID